MPPRPLARHAITGRVAPRTVDPGELDSFLRDYAARLEFALDIPGEHYSGLSNNDLLAVRQREGRPFADNNATLRRHVRTELQLRFGTARVYPSPLAVEAAARTAILEWILARLNGGLRDVRIKTLNVDYAKTKQAAGYAGQPVGVRTGAWREALTRAHVEITS